MIATRELLAHQRKLLADPTDNTIQRFSNCLYNQMLCCSMCCSQVDKAQWQHTSRLLDEKRGLHVCAKFLQCCLMPCLQVQTWAQLDVPVSAHVAHPHTLHCAPLHCAPPFLPRSLSLSLWVLLCLSKCLRFDCLVYGSKRGYMNTRTCNVPLPHAPPHLRGGADSFWILF